MKYEENIFTKIIKGEIPCKKVFEDEYCLAFYDINPKAPIHVLVIPKISVVNFADFIEAGGKNVGLIENFFKSVKYIATEVLQLEDFQIITNNGKQAGQEVLHFHVHIKGYKKKSK